MADTTGKKQRGLGRPFATGESGNPAGRPKGSRNKLGEAFLADLYSDWQAHGAQALKDCREQNPAAYVKTVASLLPAQVEMQGDGLKGMSDDELARLIDAIRAVDADDDDDGETPLH